MKKILALGTVVLLVAALVTSGTWAYFSATATIPGNTLTAGTLALTINNGVSAPVTVTNIFPGDNGTGKTGGWVIKNAASGNINAGLSVNMTGLTSAPSDNLSKYLKLLLWVGKSSDTEGFITDGDMVLNADGTFTSWTGGSTNVTGATVLTDNYTLATTLNSKTWGSYTSPIVTIPQNNVSNIFHVNYYFPETNSDQSDAMGNSSTFDLGFILYQTTATLH